MLIHLLSLLLLSLEQHSSILKQHNVQLTFSPRPYGQRGATQFWKKLPVFTFMYFQNFL